MSSYVHGDWVVQPLGLGHTVLYPPNLLNPRLSGIILYIYIPVYYIY